MVRTNNNKQLISGSVLTNEIILNIGDWNMNTTGLVTVTHGISDWTKIRTINVLIRDDANTVLYNLAGSGPSGELYGSMAVSDVSVLLVRTTGGTFDNSSFDSTSYNRGYITIKFID
jgi:hypothetical protein